MTKATKTGCALWLAATWLSSGGCRKDHPSSDQTERHQGLRGDNVLLVTLDTTRADRIGCYGYRPAATPTIDALAGSGALFEKAFAQVPLTLPSHASIMTGRYPREHGVRDNGREALGPGHPTLASIFQSRGYRTGGFVAAFVLDHKFGIARGFDVFVDDMAPDTPGSDPLEWEQPADVVTDRALGWLAVTSDAPFFCWVHYYDPHEPYQPPASYAAAGQDPYDGEVAFLDAQLKRLISWLDDKRLREDTLIVVIGDHGESFGEHGEQGHTNFTYDTNLHIPLIVSHPDVVRPGLRSDVFVESVDVLPTILDLFEWDAPEPLLSRSLKPILSGAELEDADVYSETLYVHNAFGWAQQRSLTTRHWKFISTTKAELYDRRRDPAEKENVIDRHPRVAADLHARLLRRFEEMTPGQAEKAELSESAMAKLAELGYIGGLGKDDHGEEQFLTPGLNDPKDMVGVLAEFERARELLKQARRPEDYETPLAIMERTVEAIPDSFAFQTVLGQTYQRAGKFEKSLESFTKAIQIDPTHAGSHLLRAQSLLQLERPEEAAAEFKAAVELDPNDAHVRAQYGEALQRMGRREQAVEQYTRAVELSPTMWRVHDRLCKLLKGTPSFEGAVEHFDRAVRGAAGDAFAHFALGSTYMSAGDMRRAVPHLEAAARLGPENPEALVNLGIALRELGRLDQARPVLERAASFDAVAPEALYNLGILEWKLGHADKTVEHYERAIALKPTFVEAVTELALYYRQQKRIRSAIRILRIGAEASPDEVHLINALGQILATANDAALRDGAEALVLLERAAGLTARADMLVLANLAAAHAETGDFARAISTAKEALALPAPTRRPDLAARIGAQLRLYQQGRPFHDDRL